MRFTKAQVNSGFSTPIVHVSGAAGWPAVVEEAVRGMAEILTIVVGDNVNGFKSPDSITTMTDQATLDGALDYLQDLSMQLRTNDRVDLSTHKTDKVETKCSTLVVHEDQNRESAIQNDGPQARSLRIERSKEWLNETTIRVHTFLSQTLPLLCAHQSPSVRLAVVEAAAVLLVNCGITLRTCNSLLLECLLALSCDDYEHVASPAQIYLNQLTGFRGLIWTNNDVDPVHTVPASIMADLLSSLVEQLPKVIYSANAAMAVSNGRRLAAAMYFSGPDGVSSCLLGTPIDRERFITVFKQCLSFTSAFTGPLGQVTSNHTGYCTVVSEILPAGGKHSDHNASEEESDARGGMLRNSEANKIPSMPPWLTVGTGSRLYHVLADVLRLVGVSAVSDQRNGATLFGLLELLLMDVRLAANNRETYDSNSKSVDFGQKQRDAATAACVLNEIIYGASGQWNGKIFSEFRERDSFKAPEETATEITLDNDGKDGYAQSANRVNLVKQNGTEYKSPPDLDIHPLRGQWQGTKKDFVERVLTQSASDIIHDYMATQIWVEPTDSPSSSVLTSSNNQQDIFMLQKVLIEGVGVLGIALGKEFEESGLLRLVLFPLLEKLASPNHSVSQAAATSLNTICYYCQYPAVKDLVVANLDNVLDVLCRQFRHLNMHPQSLNLLAAILRHTNTAPDLLPLLGEPLHCVVMELDVMARTSRPHLTVPLLKAMREILRAASSEIGAMLTKAMTAAVYWTSFTELENTAESAAGRYHSKVTQKTFEDSEMEERVDEFLRRIHQRQVVAKVATSCLVACGPLLASKNPQTCLLTLDVIADGISTLADAEDARRYEEMCRQALKDYCTRMHEPQSSMRCLDAINKDESETNKLLPSMNRIWPYLVVCLRQGQTSAVVRVLEVMAIVTTRCGGEFFTRRLKNDVVPVLVGLLSQGLSSVPIKRRSYPLVPLKYSQAPEQGPTALLKAQHAVLKSITSIAADKKSVSALRSSFEVIASWVVALACHVEALRVAATEAALALSTIDSDFVWILVADILSGAAEEEFSDVSLPGLADLSKVLPAWSSQRDTLWCQYTNYRGDLRDVDQHVVELLLSKLEGVPTLVR